MEYRKFLFAAAALAGALGAPVHAEPLRATPDAGGRALILAPLQLTKIQDLSFGTVVPAAVSGTVRINATSGARTFTGDVTGLPSDLGQRAYFGGAGSPNQQVFIALEQIEELTHTTNPSSKIPVLAMLLSGSPIRTIDPVTRTFFFGVGGIIQIDPDAEDGLYEATFDVTATYM